VNADNPTSLDAPNAGGGVDVPPVLESPAVGLRPQPIIIDSSMLEQRRPRENRRDFEQDLSYWQPLTIAAIVCLGVIFALQMVFDTLQSEETIVAAGALKRSNVLDGEVWRLLSAVFLHGSLDHIIGNCLVLYVLGMAVEHAYGRLQLLAVFLLSGLTGSLLSFSLSEGPSVGASGAIFGLIGCLIAFFYRFRDKIYFREKRLGTVLLFWVAYSVVTGFLTPFIDNWAHIGGLIGGAGTALFLKPQPSILNSQAALAEVFR
jgi:rhomboid protease GluP